MAIRMLPLPRWRVEDDNGNPLEGGKVYTYEPGTTTPKATFSDQNGAVANSNPVTLNSRGEATIYWDGLYKVIVETSDGVQVWEEDNYGSGETTVLTGNFNLVQNGAFELDSDGDGQPDDWDIFTYTEGTVELDDSTQSTGAQSLKFVNTGNGGGYATQANFSEVTGGDTYYWSVQVNTNNANMDVKVGVRWFDEDQSLLSESTVYNETSSAPTTWTEQSGSVSAPSNARYAKMRVYGGTGSTSATAWFDAVTLNPSSTQLDVRFPNVTGEVTSTHTEINKLDGIETVVDAPTTGSDPGLAFDTWRTPSATRPTLLMVEGSAATNGTTKGDIRLDVDESGGTTADYNVHVSFVHPNNPNGTTDIGTITTIIPVGASYRIRNGDDPNGSNQIVTRREWTL